MSKSLGIGRNDSFGFGGIWQDTSSDGFLDI
ncbi:MAG: hypothetical protein JWP25_5406 [Bradyrhizobium sp.]|nr:hypothetical protein [Bradyrhizobium sp.]